MPAKAPKNVARLNVSFRKIADFILAGELNKCRMLSSNFNDICIPKPIVNIFPAPCISILSELLITL